MKSDSIVKRNIILDCVRGGVIFLVVLSHTTYSLTYTFSYFDVQMFFIMSGIFLTSKNNLQNTFFKKTKGLVFPFLFFSVPFFFLNCVFKIYIGEDLKSISFFNPNSYMLGTEWFLIVLYLCLFMYLFLNEIDHPWIKYLFVALLFTFCYVSCLYGFSGDGDIHHQLEYLTMAGLTLPFLYVGNLYFTIEVYLKRYKVLLFLFSFILILFIGMSRPVVCIPWLIVCSNPVFFLIAPIAGFILFVTLCMMLNDMNVKNPQINRIRDYMLSILCFWGYNSLFILVIHWLMIKFLLGRLLSIVLFIYGGSYCQIFEDIICICIAVIFCSLSAYLGKYIRKIPFFF